MVLSLLVIFHVYIPLMMTTAWYVKTFGHKNFLASSISNIVDGKQCKLCGIDTI